MIQNLNTSFVYYLASPYSHPDASVREERYQRIMEFNTKLFKQGIIGYSPIVYSHELSKKYEMPTDAEFWWFFNRTMLDKCEGIIIYKMDGWLESKGVAQEIAYAQENNIPALYFEENEL